jgi:hypothetical protein
MRKIVGLIGLVGGLMATLGLTAMPTLAQAKYPPQPPENPTVVQRGGVEAGTESGTEGIAFTGRSLTLLMIVIGVLVVAGVVALIAARRRAATATG